MPDTDRGEPPPVPVPRGPAMLVQPPEPYFQFLGFVLARKADMLAASAFVLALATTGYQIVGYLRGPRLQVYPPSKVTLFFDKVRREDQQEETRARVMMQAFFANTGAPGRATVVRHVSMTLTGAGLEMKQDWSSFPVPDRSDDKLVIDEAKDPIPIHIAGGTATAQLIAFAPRAGACARGEACPKAGAAINDTDFLTAIGNNLDARLRLTVNAETSDGKAVSAACDIPITQGLAHELFRRTWYSSDCLAPGER